LTRQGIGEFAAFQQDGDADDHVVDATASR